MTLSKHPMFAAAAAAILLAFLPLGAAPASAGRITATSAGSPEGTVSFPAMGWNNSTTVTIPAGADVLSASLSITGLPDEADAESYPGTPGLSIGGQWAWRFEGDANGLLGRQSEFVMAPTGDKVSVGPGTPAVLNIRLPAAAVVTGAGLTLEGTGVLSPTLDAGADGAPDWSFSGAFSTAQAVLGLEGPMNDFLRNRAVAFPDSWGNQMTSVPVLLGAESAGTLKVTGLRVIYDAVLPVGSLGPALNSAAHTGLPGDTVIPLGLFSDHRGRLRVSNISIEYDHPPTTTLLAPADGAVVNTTEVVCAWSSADPDGDPLVYYFNLRGPGGNQPTMVVTDTSHTVEGLEPGDYVWSVTPNDGFQNGTCLSGEFKFRVVSPGAVPVVALLDPADGAALAAGPVALRWTPYNPVSGEVSYNIYLDESDATTLLFELFGSANNSFLAASLPADRAYRWTVVPYLSVGSETVKGYCASGIWTFTLGNASAGGPHPPRITSTAPAPALVGYLYSYQVAAVDDHGDTLSYSLSDFPPGMVIDFSTGVIRWTPEPNQTGAFPVTVSVTDGRSRTGQSFTVTVTTGTPPPPSVRIAYPKDGARANHSLYIMGAASSAPGAPQVRTVEVRLDSGPWVNANLSGDGWSCVLDTSRSRNGAHRVAVRAYDGTAYSAEANLTLTYDNPHSVLLDYPLKADQPPLPFLVLIVIILAAVPLAIYINLKRRERLAPP
jgi:hypothetical protein